MSRTYAIIGLLLCTKIIFCVLPNDLVFTPIANFTEDQTEFGYQFTYYTISTDIQNAGFYFNHNFSKKIRYGAEYFSNGETKTIAHHFAIKLISFFNKSNYHLNISGNLNYISSNEINLIDKTLYDKTLTVSWTPIESPINVHYTLAKAKGSNKFENIGAISYQQNWGLLSLEWNGEFINISNYIHIEKVLTLRAGISRNIKDKSELIFKTSFGITDTLDKITSKKSKRKTSITVSSPNITVDTNVGLNHIQEGMRYYYNGDYRKAKKSYLLAKSFFPHSAIVYKRLGSIYYKLGDFEKAKFSWEKSYTLSPSEKTKQFIRTAKEKLESQY